ncbi:MAG: hypothetical protein ACI4R9_05850 [Kiritimatiellia bacterium]
MISRGAFPFVAAVDKTNQPPAVPEMPPKSYAEKTRRGGCRVLTPMVEQPWWGARDFPSVGGGDPFRRRYKNGGTAFRAVPLFQ